MASSPSFSLQNQVAVLSGGLGDIGLATAQALLEAGASVALSDLAAPDDARDRLASALGSLADKTFYACVDTSREDAVKQWLQGVATQVGTPSIAVVNAAVVESGSAMSVSEESWRRHLDINLSGALWMAREAARRMVDAQIAGRVVLVGSWAAHAPHPQIVAYSVAKAGLRMLCQCLALELAPHGITVNEIAPGFVDAGLSARLFEQDPALRERCLERVPTGRILGAEDVAREILALCDPQRGHLTGASVVVDGGLSLLVGRSRHEMS
jgi:glucose 1-dehydrogenase